MTLTIIALWILWRFYKTGGFSAIIKAAARATEAEEIPKRCEPVRVYKPIQERQPEPETIDRAKLERIAQNWLTSQGVLFDTYYYVRNKSDLELMDLITEFNIRR